MEISSVLQNNVALKARINEQSRITVISVDNSQIKIEKQFKEIEVKTNKQKSHSFLEIFSALQNNVALKARISEQS